MHGVSCLSTMPEPVAQLSATPQSAGTTIIGIAGGSGSGKSFLATHLASTLSADVLSVDSYYHDLSDIPFKERTRRNMDHPSAIDFSLFAEQVRALSKGETVPVPEYDFCTHTRTGRSHLLHAPGVMIVEGIFALYDEAIRRLCSLKVFVELESDTCLERRIERDVRERDRTPECVRNQYNETVRPMYEQFIAPSKQYADIVVRGDDDIRHSVGLVIEALRGAVNKPATPRTEEQTYSGL
jgi:uridine kinase